MADAQSADDLTSPLARRVSLPLLVLYGLGTIVGAGIYVLVGGVAARAGIYAPIAFLTAAVIATFTALSYGELSSRFPRSAGEAVYLDNAFHRRWLAGGVGWAIVFTGIVSAATIANGFVGYLGVFFHLPSWLVKLTLIGTLAAVAIRGIEQSVWFAATITVLSILGLCIVLVLSGDAITELPGRWREMLPPVTSVAWMGVLSGAFLAFYAFIGFEDMVNLAEEVKDPRFTMPRGIVVALVLATVLYVLVAAVAVLSLPIEALAASEAPLADVVSKHGPRAVTLISILSLLSVTNSALAQIIMGSRVLYGMGGAGTAPRIFARVEPRTQTPVVATCLVGGAVVGFAWWLPLIRLAEITSSVVLVVFLLINVALIKIKLSDKSKGSSPLGVRTHLAVPVLGGALCLLLIAAGLISA